MSINNLKGTLYDLLGYFAPGLVATIGGLIMILRFQNKQDILTVLSAIANSLSAFEVFVVIIVSYVLGHAIASISSFLIEKKLMISVKMLKNAVDISSILDGEHHNAFCRKYESIFQTSYNDSAIRRAICYVQSKQPAVYETALVFLAFYGMARNLALVFGIFFVAEAVLCYQKRGDLSLLILIAILGIIFTYEYIRFRKYYLDTILSGFLIPDREKEN